MDLGEFSYYFRIWNPSSDLSKTCRYPILDQSLTGPDLTGLDMSVKFSPRLAYWPTRRSCLQYLTGRTIPNPAPFRRTTNPNNGHMGRICRQIRTQFVVIDAKGEAQIKLKNMKLGWRWITEYWNEFRLTSSKVELDDSTAGEWLLTGMNTELQDGCGADSDDYKSMAEMAQWAIHKEIKLATVWHIQKDWSNKGATTLRNTDTPRNPDRIYRPAKNNNQNYGQLMDLDVTLRQPKLYISMEEFQKRMRE